ncbi:MAG TPA: hypothetical protein VKE41_10555 [Roseiflexaceae bacterium]|nr:hypothetical protein [Roseiflexaceae bacterium]
MIRDRASEPLAESPQTIPPICKRCGRFLRRAEEREREYCERCQPPAPPPEEDERFCCRSDPPCPSCPYVVGWD